MRSTSLHVLLQGRARGFSNCSFHEPFNFRLAQVLLLTGQKVFAKYPLGQHPKSLNAGNTGTVRGVKNQVNSTAGAIAFDGVAMVCSHVIKSQKKPRLLYLLPEKL